MTAASASEQPWAIAVLGPTASGKSALGISLAERIGGEVVNCDSTAVYRGFDIGTDKVPIPDQRGIPHHLVDVVGPAGEYTAADYARDATRVIAGIRDRGRVPIIVGGTGFYFRALVRGLFPGPGRDAALRHRLDGLAARAGADRLHRFLAYVDPASGERIHPNDRVRIVRALEVYFQTGRALTEHFAETCAPLDGWVVVAMALRPTWPEMTARIADRVDRQFERGIVDEVRALVDAGVPATARPFGGYVYRYVLEVVSGVRDEASARELIVRENRRYARRQLIWFRKEPNLEWIAGTGEREEATTRALSIVEAQRSRVWRSAGQEEGHPYAAG